MPPARARSECRARSELPASARPLRVEVVCDGGSLGNPGRGYGSYRWRAGDGPWSEPVRLSFGNQVTNNEAEYCALIAALASVRAAFGAAEPVAVEVITDSRLLAEQMSGRWRLRAPNLFALHDEARRLAASFAAITFHWRPREEVVSLLGH